LYSVFFALAELAVRNFGYPTDNTFIYLALFCLLFSGPFLYEMLTGRSFFTVIAGQKHGDGN
jgi:hypothetical protein